MRSWRKQMKTVFLVAIYCILLVSCKKEKAIPFVLESGMPCITLTFSNSESNKCELCFGIDTGCYSARFYYGDIVKMYPNFSDTDVDFWTSRGADIKIADDKTISAIGFYNVKSDKVNFPKLWIENDTTLINTCGTKRAGLLGYTDLEKFGVVVFDFRKKKLVLGEDKVKKNRVLLSKDEYEDHLYIPIKIDGEEYLALLDTGFKSDGELCLSVNENAGFPDYVTVQIGNTVYEDVWCDWHSDGIYSDLKITENPNDVLGDTIILGNAFFKNHRIQLDFENMTFAMD